MNGRQDSKRSNGRHVVADSTTDGGKDTTAGFGRIPGARKKIVGKERNGISETRGDINDGNGKLNNAIAYR